MGLIEKQAAIDAFADLYWMDERLLYFKKEIDATFDKIIALPSAQPEIIRCKDCKHKPTTTPDYKADNGDCGFEIEFPDYRCPCQCDDGWYNRLPDDDWFCGNAERKDHETD